MGLDLCGARRSIAQASFIGMSFFAMSPGTMPDEWTHLSAFSSNPFSFIERAYFEDYNFSRRQTWLVTLVRRVKYAEN